MANSFRLPAKGQISLDQYADNAEYGRARQGLVQRARAYTFTQQGKGGDRKVAYFPVKGEGAQFLTGAARVVAETLYGLFVKSSADSLSEAVAWAIDTAPALMAAADTVDVGNGRQAQVSQRAYRDGVDYFEQSMNWAFEQSRAAKRERSRRNGYRRTSDRHLTATVGEAVGA